jgi:hypothetical protein
MDDEQTMPAQTATYKLRNTAIYGTLETVKPHTTRCTFRHNGHEVSASINVRLSAFEFMDFIHTTNDIRFEVGSPADAIDDFSGWDLVLNSEEDDWTPVD